VIELTKLPIFFNKLLGGSLCFNFFLPFYFYLGKRFLVTKMVQEDFCQYLWYSLQFFGEGDIILYVEAGLQEYFQPHFFTYIEMVKKNCHT